LTRAPTIHNLERILFLKHGAEKLDIHMTINEIKSGMVVHACNPGTVKAKAGIMSLRPTWAT
jgi:hypothetical protein